MIVEETCALWLCSFTLLCVLSPTALHITRVL